MNRLLLFSLFSVTLFLCTLFVPNPVNADERIVAFQASCDKSNELSKLEKAMENASSNGNFVEAKRYQDVIKHITKIENDCINTVAAELRDISPAAGGN